MSEHEESVMASEEEKARNTLLGISAMAEAHDAKAWAKCVAVGDAWLEARGVMPALCCVWYAQSLMGVGRYDEAVSWAEIAVKHLPSQTTEQRIALCAARSTYAQALARVGRFVKAKSILKQMTQAPIEHPETLEKQGHILLAISDKWKQGWAQHEARLSNTNLPEGFVRWDGVSQGRLAVLHEQGIGDAVLFARWLEEAARWTGQDVVWFGPERVLGRWMADLPGVIVGERGDVPTPTDFAIYAMSLPHYLHCERPTQVPPAVAPRSLIEQRAAYSLTPGRMRVGVCWKGSADGWHDFERSFAALEFAPIWAELHGVEFVNLCHGAEVPADAPFVARSFTDIYQTGEEIADLDLVVTVDTSVAHIAGSLDVPTLVLAPTVPDWRYQWPARSGCGSAFYESVTVIRRQRADDLEVIQHARAMIEQFADALNQRAA